jgi:hypothetical protein
MRVLPAKGLRLPSVWNFKEASLGVIPKTGFLSSGFSEVSACASRALGRNVASETADEPRRNFRRLWIESK